MPRYSPTTTGLTPKGRVGAAKSASKQLIAANSAREEVLFSVDHETARVWLALGPTAVAGEGPFALKTNGLIRLLTKSEISIITDTEGPNEVQKVTITATGGTFKLRLPWPEKEWTAAITWKPTAAVVKEKLEAKTGETVKVEGAEGGPFTITFEGKLKAMDVGTLEADATSLEGAGAKVAVETTTPGGISVVLAEA